MRHWGTLRLYIQCGYLIDDSYKPHIGRLWRYEIKRIHTSPYLCSLLMCLSFIQLTFLSQDLSNSVCLLVTMTLVFSSIDSDHSSYLFSVNTVIHHLYDDRSTLTIQVICSAQTLLYIVCMTYRVLPNAPHALRTTICLFLGTVSI